MASPVSASTAPSVSEAKPSGNGTANGLPLHSMVGASSSTTSAKASPKSASLTSKVPSAAKVWLLASMASTALRLNPSPTAMPSITGRSLVPVTVTTTVPVPSLSVGSLPLVLSSTAVMVYVSVNTSPSPKKSKVLSVVEPPVSESGAKYGASKPQVTKATFSPGSIDPGASVNHASTSAVSASSRASGAPSISTPVTAQVTVSGVSTSTTKKLPVAV